MAELDECPCGIARVDCDYHKPSERVTIGSMGPSSSCVLVVNASRIKTVADCDRFRGLKGVKMVMVIGKYDDPAIGDYCERCVLDPIRVDCLTLC